MVLLIIFFFSSSAWYTCVAVLGARGRMGCGSSFSFLKTVISASALANASPDDWCRLDGWSGNKDEMMCSQRRNGSWKGVQYIYTLWRWVLRLLTYFSRRCKCNSFGERLSKPDHLRERTGSHSWWRTAPQILHLRIWSLPLLRSLINGSLRSSSRRTIRSFIIVSHHPLPHYTPLTKLMGQRLTIYSACFPCDARSARLRVP